MVTVTDFFPPLQLFVCVRPHLIIYQFVNPDNLRVQSRSHADNTWTAPAWFQEKRPIFFLFFSSVFDKPVRP